MFTVAGRMIGHSFLHHGPSFPGLSPAIVHTLLGGPLETTPVTVRDCPDLDIRDSVKMVIERTRHQINQFQNGLKETGLWPLLIHRRDVIPILFPRESEAQLTPQMILDCIIWPSSITIIFESYKELDDDDESAITDVHRVSGYLKTFVGNASPVELKRLVKFWIGWELPATEMKVEVVEASLPTASTCFEKLRLPRHYATYKIFHQDLCACISTSYSGFGCP
ncbi:Hypothetical protein SMAX5B_014926 [Scophthalmus maximus]|uniref:HECT domain-containing protein n=1 Tax=Scophthalmus maximus TaxID=52904 RepID=A0A2U9BZW8_SCOMX|nr:Hypothetical protein SMAX5B_014926 [Scophthalmus maximus]